MKPNPAFTKMVRASGGRESSSNSFAIARSHQIAAPSVWERFSASARERIRLRNAPTARTIRIQDEHRFPAQPRGAMPPSENPIAKFIDHVIDESAFASPPRPHARCSESRHCARLEQPPHQRSRQSSG